MKHAQIAFSIIASAAAAIGLGVLVSGLPETNGAPQQAALAALVLAFVVPVYVIARCVEMIASGRES